MKRDPHSPLLVGTERAFSFFETEENQDVVEEFAPRHLKGVLSRIVDTWSWVVVFCELLLSYKFGGVDGLFVAYTSGWICQTITLWFNVVNHPPGNDDNVAVANGSDKPKKLKLCKATNGKETTSRDFHYLPFLFLDTLVPLFALFVMETEHEHHHEHERLAKRSKFDIAYWGFIWPLEKMGLVWNVEKN